MKHCKVFAQYRWNEPAVEVFDTAKSARFMDDKNKKKNARKAAEDYAKPMRASGCGVTFEEYEVADEKKEVKNG